MYEFGEQSLAHLNKCDERLQRIALSAIQIIDFTILTSFRDQATQDELFRLERTKLQWPNSAHNQEPSFAIDIAPWPVIWPDPIKRPQYLVKDYGRFYYLAGIFKTCAFDLGIPVIWGGDWNSNNSFTDQNFDDLPHFQLA